MKRALGYDDSLDVFGVHGVGGFVGAILTGVFAAKVFGAQLGLQFLGATTTLVYSGGMTFIIIKVLDRVIGLRVASRWRRKPTASTCRCTTKKGLVCSTPYFTTPSAFHAAISSVVNPASAST